MVSVLISSAKGYLADGDLTSANTESLHALGIDADCYEAYAVLAASAVAEHRFAEAYELSTRSIKVAASVNAPRSRRAFLHIQRARGRLTPAGSLESRDPDACGRLLKTVEADILSAKSFGNSKYVDYLVELLEFDVEFQAGKLDFNRGQYKSALNHTNAASLALSRVLHDDPDDARARYEEGELKALKGLIERQGPASVARP